MLVPNVNPYYYISTKGRVWSTKIGKSGDVMKTYFTKNGYEEVTLSRFNMPSISILIHRAEMLLFNWIPGCEYLDVNHKDGDKSNNDITNLEWTTHSENITHAYNTGLKKKGEGHPMSNHTEFQVRKICEGLEKKLELKDCAILAGLEPNDTNMKFVSNIKYHKTWVNISSQYNIPKERNSRLFSDEEVHQICKLLEQGYNQDEIMSILRPDLEKSQYYNVMGTIRRRTRFQNISDNYNF